MSRQQDIDLYLLADRVREFQQPEISHEGSKAVEANPGWARLRLQELCWTLERLGKRIFPQVARDLAAAPRQMSERPVWNGERPPAQAAPRVLIDVTGVSRLNHRTGIQRVVVEIAEAALALGGALPVVIEEGRLRSYFRHPSLPETVEIREDDVFLFLDASWNYLDEATAVLDELSRRKATSVACVYDVIPLLHPLAFHADTARSFSQWFDRLARRCDALVAISGSVADETRRLLGGLPGAQTSPPVRWFRLGSDFGAQSSGPATPRAAHICGAPSPFFLSVGTLEPRKAYPVALDAFEKLWASGHDARYVIAGKLGWHARALRRRLVDHPEFGQRLFWLEDASDAELDCLYRGTRGVVAASFAEGFGLPLVEGMQRGASVLASDIPVFREVAGEAAVYFRPLDSDDLARVLREQMTAPARSGPPPATLSWRQSATELLQRVRACRTSKESAVAAA